MKTRFWSMLAVGCVTISLLAGELALEQDSTIKKVPTTRRIVALTFDDGPDPATTKELTAVLAAKNVHATFFVLGSKVERYPELAALLAQGGHEVQSHGYNHISWNRLSPADLVKELDHAAQAIAAVGPKPTLARPPGGGYNDSLVARLKQMGYTTILWSIDPRDWERRPAAQTVEIVVKNTGPGDIILLHEGDCARQTITAVGSIIDKLRQSGYEFVTVSELLQYYEIRQ